MKSNIHLLSYYSEYITKKINVINAGKNTCILYMYEYRWKQKGVDCSTVLRQMLIMRSQLAQLVSNSATLCRQDISVVSKVIMRIVFLLQPPQPSLVDAFEICVGDHF